MKKSFYYLLMLMLAFTLAACGSADTPTEEVVEEEPTQVLENEEPTDEPEPAATEEEAAPATQEGEDNMLAKVRERGVLKCAGNEGLVGFGFRDPDSNDIVGFDVDFCKAIAAAVFGEGGADKVEVIPTTGTTRFTVMQSGEADVLIRNTTWTSSRDTDLGLDFGPTTFYDGQGMMVRADSGIEMLTDLDGASVCVQAGTTTEKNLADVVNALEIDVDSQVYEDNASTVAAFSEGLCDGFTTDKSGLVATQTTFDNPADYVILEETMSKEPLGPAVNHGDNNWGDIMMWSTYCTMQAEESGVTMDNVDEMLETDNPVIKNFLGVDSTFGEAMGLSTDFCYQIIKQVGNYGEIYDRHLGPDTPIKLARGINAMYTEGGLIYSPPIR